MNMQTLLLKLFLSLFMHSPAECTENSIHLSQPAEMVSHDKGYVCDERIIIHTDRDIYIAGERLYYRIDLPGGNNGMSSGVAYIALRNTGNDLIVTSSLNMEGRTGYSSIYLPDTLSSSVYQIVAFTNWMRNFGEEHYSEKQILIINRFDEQLELPVAEAQEEYAAEKRNIRPADGILPGSSGLADRPVEVRPVKPVYGTREKVQIELLPRGLADSAAYLSVAVSHAKTILDHNEGKQNSKDDVQGSTSAKITHTSFIRFFRETDGPVITGQVVDSDSREGVPGATVFLTTPDDSLNLLYAKTLEDGMFHFRLNDFHEGRKIYFAVYERDIAESSEIRINDKFELHQPFLPETGIGEESLKNHLRKSQDIVRINKTLGIDFNSDLETERPGYRPLIYSSANHSLRVSGEYVYLNDLHEITREILPWLRIRRHSGDYTVNMMIEEVDLYRQATPALFLDGIYTDDISRIIHLDTDMIDRIEIHRQLWRHGDIILPGIAAFFTNSLEYRDLDLATGSVTAEHSPATFPSVYRPPNHGEPGIESRSRPDFRQLLYWEPDVTMVRNGTGRLLEFYSGDLKGEYLIRVRGFTCSGEIISEQATILIE